MTTQRPLDVLTVNYGSPERLERCIASARRHLPDSQIRVWDNRSSRSADVRRFAEQHPDIDWVFSEEGIGYAAAMNRLVARSDHDTVTLNGDDVLVGPLTRTRAALRGHRVAAVSPTMVDLSGRGERWDVARRRQTLVRMLVQHTGYAGRLRRVSLLSDLYPSPPSEVDGYINPVGQVVSREAWEAIGPLDERFFVYGEDAEWHYRARSLGWRILLVDEQHVQHITSQAGGGPRSPHMVDLLRANQAALAGMRGGRGPGALLMAGDAVTRRVQRSRRRQDAREAAERAERSGGRTGIVLTVPDRNDAKARTELANELVLRGWPVTVVCLDDELGVLQRRLDTEVRMLLRPWWLPEVDTTVEPTVMITGDAPSEVRFAGLWSAIRRGARTWVVAGPELGGPVPGARSRRLAQAVDRGRARPIAVPVGDNSGAIADAYLDMVQAVHGR